MTNYVPCPKCGGPAEKLKFAWWGGLLGPKILTHVKCTAYGYKYNGKAGKDNTNGIIVYCVIVGILCLAIVVVMFAALILLAVATR